VKDELGSHIEAIKDYDMAIRLKPDFFEAYFNLGLSKQKLEKYDDAIKDFSIMIQHCQDFAITYTYSAQCYWRLADNESNPARKKELIALAEKDEQKAESLQQQKQE
jgi:tetratricopeptide (TPR) repeat protein